VPCTLAETERERMCFTPTPPFWFTTFRFSVIKLELWHLVL